MNAVTRLASKLDRIKVIIGFLLFLLPLIGASPQSLIRWVDRIYNIDSYLTDVPTKKDSLEILLFIEDALYNDIVSEKLRIKELTANTEMPQEVKDELIEAHFKSYNHNVLKIERIRVRIKVLDPAWKSLEELADEQ